jgi:hypothetical protein
MIIQINKFKTLLKYYRNSFYSYYNLKRNRQISASWELLLKIHNIEINSLNKVKIFSYYQSNIDNKIVYYQKAVFDKLEIPILQICSDKSHGEWLNELILSLADEKYIIIFDIDCIPLSKMTLIKMLQDIQDGQTLSGAIQTANHKSNGENIYVGPFFMGFSINLLRDIGEFNFNESLLNDVGAEFSQKVISMNKKIKYWFPTKIEIPKWKLYPDQYFGLGTTYDGLVYHAFEIRIPFNKYRFIKKCQSILNKKN